VTYPSIRIEGQIFSGDLLQRLDQPDTPGQRPADFGLPADVKVKDEIARAWSASQSYYRAFRAKTGSAQQSSLTPDTRNLLLLPLLTLLGYKPDYARKGETVNGKTFPISHRDDSRDGLPVHLLGWNDSLDKRRDDGSGPRMSPHALVQEYLNLTEHLYGIVSNGRTLRLLRDSTRLVRQSFIEFDLERMFDEDLFADFAVLFRLLHATRLPDTQANAPASLIEKYHQDALDQGARIRDGLRDAVEAVLVLLGTGFLEDDALQGRFSGSNALTPKAYYHHLLRLVYRLLFLLVAEERGLIHPADAKPRDRTVFNRHYAVSRLRRLALRAHLVEKRHTDLWLGLLHTFRLFEFDGPGAKLGIAPLGGHLFGPDALGPLTSARIPNTTLLKAVFRLCFFTDDHGTKTAVNYGALATEEFGSVYESLLELNPVIEGRTFSFRKAAGNERKTSGSYYTPDSLVQCLLDSALEPVVEEAVKGKSPEEAAGALLNLKVCDPAAGSGHFLLGAAHRMARRLALIRSRGDEPSPSAYRTALRDVIGRCIYAVDINPMAVELCKINLWLEAMEPGKPLTFLDHHIQCGNALLGATPGLMARGIPDEAFEPIEGDDKKYCAQFRKQNKSERSGQLSLFAADLKPWDRIGNLAAAMVSVDKLPDDTPEAVRTKERRYAELVRSGSYETGRQLADTWCAAFVWKKCPPAAGGFDYPITHELYTRLERSPHDAPKWMRDEIRRLATQYQFFHWYLAFPEVFQPLETIDPKDSNGWKGGFDLVLGNPPWEKIKLLELEFFASRSPSIADAQTGAARKRLIAGLPMSDPDLWEEWNDASTKAQGESQFARHSGRFPLCGKGDINTYALFAEHNWRTIAPRGRAGFLVPSGIATDDTTKDYFKAIIESGALWSMWEFENEGFFTAGQGHMVRFVLTTLSGTDNRAEAADFMFQGHNLADLQNPERHFRLTAEDIDTINPNTGTCPIFQTQRDARIALTVYRRTGVLWRENDPDGNPWGLKFLRMFDMTNDSSLFRTRGEMVAAGWTLQGNRFVKEGEVMLPLYEAKMVYTFNHRSGSFEQAASGERPHRLPSSSDCQLQDATYVPLPCYWVAQADVEAKINDFWDHDWLLGWRDVTDARASVRTVVACLIGRTAVNNKLPLFLPVAKPAMVGALYGNLASFALDYAARQKLGGITLNYFIMKQLPVLPPAQYLASPPWAGRTTVVDWLLPRVLELTYTAWDLKPFAEDCGDAGPPYIWDAERRFQLQCELDAAFFHLYEIPREDVNYILDTFPVVRNNDMRAYQEYRTKRVILEIYDMLARALETGQPYVSPLPPPRRAT
jgi:hypothetical protein